MTKEDTCNELFFSHLQLLGQETSATPSVSWINKAKGAFRIDTPKRLAADWGRYKNPKSKKDKTYDNFM